MRPASDDASFRRYFRIDRDPDRDPDRHFDHAPGPDAGAVGTGSLIAMDAPPPMEDCRPFVHAADVFGRAGVTVPTVLEADLERGFLLLSDFGSTTYLDVLDERTAPRLYQDATGMLVTMQRASRPGVFGEYDHALLMREARLYPEWYVARHKGVTLDDDERRVLDDALELIVRANLAQPRVFVHRDYHSRNLMVLDGTPAGPASPGVLDFQDAVHGPITYDLVSLLRDAYIQWDEEQVLDWAIRYWEQARAAGLPVSADFGEFYRDFEWMGLQRHLKVLGIFARLHHRDGKDRYLADLPRVLGYVTAVVKRYSALGPLARLLDRIEERSVQAGYSF
jgi:aminoglycoside/choline kinase family phosphotransferase